MSSEAYATIERRAVFWHVRSNAGLRDEDCSVGRRDSVSDMPSVLTRPADYGFQNNADYAAEDQNNCADYGAETWQ